MTVTAGALDGIVVADFSRVLAGPYATMMLGDFGAEVIKIERPGVGDDTRAWGPPFDSDGEATYFNSVNRNKRSVVLDLTDPADVRGPASWSRRRRHRRGELPARHHGAARARLRRPAGHPARRDLLLHHRIRPGGGAALPGYDLLVQAVGGLMSVTGPEPGEPDQSRRRARRRARRAARVERHPGRAAHRDRTGEGQRVETNLLSALLSSMVNQASGYLGAGVVPGIMGNRHPSIAPYEVFQTADRPHRGRRRQRQAVPRADRSTWL